MAAVLNEAQRRFVLESFAQDYSPSIVVGKIKTTWGLTLQPGDIVHFRNRDFLNPIDRKIFDDAVADWETKDARFRWANRLRQVSSLCHDVDAAIDRDDHRTKLALFKEINELYGGAGVAPGETSVDKITRTIVDPAPIEEQQ